MINLGSTAATLVIPLLLDRVSPRVAFGVPGVAHGGGARRVLDRPAAVRARAAGPRGPCGGARGGRSRAARRRRVGTARTLLRILAVFAPISAFWALFFQYGSSWTLQADKMGRDVLGFRVAAGQVQTLDALLVLTLIPLFAVSCSRRSSGAACASPPLGKMTVGMFVMVLSFVAAAGVQWALEAGHAPHVAWQVPQYVFLAMGEVLVSVTALEFAYAQAPARLKSVVMGLWYLTIAAGTFLTAVVAWLNRFHGVALLRLLRRADAGGGGRLRVRRLVVPAGGGRGDVAGRRLSRRGGARAASGGRPPRSPAIGRARRSRGRLARHGRARALPTPGQVHRRHRGLRALLVLRDELDPDRLHAPAPAARRAGGEGELPLLRDGDLPHAAGGRLDRRPVPGAVPDHPLDLARSTWPATRCWRPSRRAPASRSGLALIAAGAGGIKPCVSAFVGDQFRPEQRTLLQRVYGWFYWVINLGSATSKLLIPLLLVTLGPRFAFALPGVLMAVALLVFWLGRRHYVAAPPSGPNPHGFLRVVGRAVSRAGTGAPGRALARRRPRPPPRGGGGGRQGGASHHGRLRRRDAVLGAVRPEGLELGAAGEADGPAVLGGSRSRRPSSRR